MGSTDGGMAAVDIIFLLLLLLLYILLLLYQYTTRRVLSGNQRNNNEGQNLQTVVNRRGLLVYRNQPQIWNRLRP